MSDLLLIHEIHLPCGAVALVDAADRDLVAGFSWHRTNKGYVRAFRRNMDILLHRLVMGAGPDEFIDHANGDRLDNRTGNLRFATRSENGANRGKDNLKRTPSSPYKGVCWDRNRQTWLASITTNGKSRSLGRFPSEIDAALAYNRAAVEQWGEFARVNVIQEPRP